MNYIDPHIHMISRVTDDYHRMAQCGCVAISEPAFWAGFDRGSAAGFRDYFHHLTEIEPKRAAQFGIRHFSWLCINAKEAVNIKEQQLRGTPDGGSQTNAFRWGVGAGFPVKSAFRVTTEFTGEQLRGWMAGGAPQLAELALMRDVEYVDLPTGHWPQFTRPDDLAAVILAAIERR